ncbi:urea transporter [Phyllosticta citribraziliensis]|uniref:Urea transporter n=1 Tax=Phyllosticta citribraziliensis TaxID=989973 RepID=A0ABR1LQ12_9PEZI
MGIPSFEASNAIIYLTYGALLLSGVAVAWRLRHQSKGDYLSSNRTQKAIPLALNFIASGLGSGILFTYPEISTIAGVQGLVVYSLSSGLPLLAFGWLGPVIRRKCPDGFVLTEWTRKRYGAVTALYLSVMTLITLFLYMVAELSALQQTVNALTGLDGLPAVIVECVVTTIYTTLGGFKVSFITNNIQAAMVIGLILIGVITVGSTTHIDRSLIASSGLLDSSLLGWQLIYILPVAVLTNDFFLSGFWMRTFASRTDKDLKIGTAIASASVTAILVLVGSTGLLAAWSGALSSPSADGSVSFFLLLAQLPAWVIGIVLVMVVALSTSAFDSFQSAMVSTGSNDLFRNRLSLWWIRAGVILIIAPTIVVALKSPSVLQVYLISDLVSAALIPVLLIGLWDRCYAWRGFEVVVGGLGGIFTVWLFGTVYYGNVKDGANLILLEKGLYTDDWSAFGAFVAAPVGGLLWAAVAFVGRVVCQMVYARVKGVRFDAFDDPRELVVETDERAEGGAKVVTTVPKDDEERGRFV